MHKPLLPWHERAALGCLFVPILLFFLPILVEEVARALISGTVRAWHRRRDLPRRRAQLTAARLSGHLSHSPYLDTLEKIFLQRELNPLYDLEFMTRWDHVAEVQIPRWVQAKRDAWRLGQLMMYVASDNAPHFSSYPDLRVSDVQRLAGLGAFQLEGAAELVDPRFREELIALTRALLRAGASLRRPCGGLGGFGGLVATDDLEHPQSL